MNTRGDFLYTGKAHISLTTTLEWKVNADFNYIRNKNCCREIESGFVVTESFGPTIARAVAAGATYSWNRSCGFVRCLLTRSVSFCLFCTTYTHAPSKRSILEKTGESQLRCTSMIPAIDAWPKGTRYDGSLYNIPNNVIHHRAAILNRSVIKLLRCYIFLITENYRIHIIHI